MSTLFEMQVIRAVTRWWQRGSYGEEAAMLSDGLGFVMKPSRHHKKFMASLILSTFALSGAATAVTYPNWEVSLVFGFISAIVSAIGMTTFKRTVTVTPKGVNSFSPFSGRTAVEWRDVISVRFRTWGQTIRIRNRDGRTIVLPVYMSGLKMLENEFESRLPVYVWVGAFNKLKRHLASL